MGNSQGSIVHQQKLRHFSKKKSDWVDAELCLTEHGVLTVTVSLKLNSYNIILISH